MLMVMMTGRLPVADDHAWMAALVAHVMGWVCLLRIARPTLPDTGYGVLLHRRRRGRGVAGPTLRGIIPLSMGNW